MLVSSGGDGGLVATHDGEPLRPGRGCYVDAVDYDQDGDLDLIVGGYSKWVTPPSEHLTPEDTENLAKWDAELALVETVFAKFLADAKAAAAGKSTEEGQKIYDAMFANEEFKKVQRQRRDLLNQIPPPSPRAVPGEGVRLALPPEVIAVAIAHARAQETNTGGTANAISPVFSFLEASSARREGSLGVDW